VHLSRSRAFTLIELLVVIAIIAVLMGLAFPAFQSVQNSAKRTQAKNDLVQIVTAVSAFYTEYGRYPLGAAASGDDYDYGATRSSKEFFDAIRGIDPVLNPRLVEFIKPPDAKDQNSPRSGMGSTADGQFYDPWGKPYAVRIDADYDGQVGNPYSAHAGAVPKLRQGIIAWSYGKDQRSQAGADKNTGDNKDDVISWQ